MAATTKKANKDAKAEAKPKLRIKLRAYDHKVIDNCTKQIIETIYRYGAEVLGPIPLPIRDSQVYGEPFHIRPQRRARTVRNPCSQAVA